MPTQLSRRVVSGVMLATGPLGCHPDCTQRVSTAEVDQMVSMARVGVGDTGAVDAIECENACYSVASALWGDTYVDTIDSCTLTVSASDTAGSGSGQGHLVCSVQHVLNHCPSFM